MAEKIIVLSGPIASGKSKLSDALATGYGLVCLKTRELIQELEQPDLDRKALQKAGEKLDKKYGGEWVAKALSQVATRLDENAILLLDSARTSSQIDAVRLAFGARVVHIHITAPEEVLEARFLKRNNDIKEAKSYATVKENPTERKVGELANIADIVINTARSTEEDVLVRVACHLGFYERSVNRLVDVLIGGQYGSEGKGNIASYLAPEYDVLVRVGGPNAGHKVFEIPEPVTFHHLPSGTLRAPEAKIILGPGAVIWPEGLLKEIGNCEVEHERLFIDPQAMVIEPSDRTNEKGGLTETIGSTGQGVGLATSRKILRTAADPPVRLASQVKELHPFIKPTLEILERAFSQGKKVLLEGTQGTGLSIHHAHYPYVTSRETSVGGCTAESGIAPSRVRKILMVCRTYPIRVQNPKRGTSGPMQLELDLETIADRSGVPIEELNRTEKTSTTKRMRRIGEFDWTLLRKATSLNGPTDIVLTFADYISIKNRDAYRFDQLTPETIQFIGEIEQVAAAPVSLISTKFDHRNIIDRRAW